MFEKIYTRKLHMHEDHLPELSAVRSEMHLDMCEIVNRCYSVIALAYNFIYLPAIVCNCVTIYRNRSVVHAITWKEIEI